MANSSSSAPNNSLLLSLSSAASVRFSLYYILYFVLLNLSLRSALIPVTSKLYRFESLIQYLIHSSSSVSFFPNIFLTFYIISLTLPLSHYFRKLSSSPSRLRFPSLFLPFSPSPPKSLLLVGNTNNLTCRFASNLMIK